jgi:hypothetical protein
VALGWGPFELFGCDSERPFVRIDQAGLLWLLNGNRLRAFLGKSLTYQSHPLLTVQIEPSAATSEDLAYYRHLLVVACGVFGPRLIDAVGDRTASLSLYRRHQDKAGAVVAHAAPRLDGRRALAASGLRGDP